AALLITLLAGLGVSTVMYFREQRQRVAAEWEGYKSSLVAARSDIDVARSDDARARLRRIPKQLRGWEWYYLYWLSDRTITTLDVGQSGEPRIAFSRDGSHVFVAAQTLVRAWELPSFRRSGNYGPFKPILALTQDGSRLACRATGKQPNSIEIV